MQYSCIDSRLIPLCDWQNPVDEHPDRLLGRDLPADYLAFTSQCLEDIIWKALKGGVERRGSLRKTKIESLTAALRFDFHGLDR